MIRKTTTARKAPRTPPASNLTGLGAGVVSTAIVKKSQRLPRRKFHNVPTTVDGITFDSQKEAERYVQLQVLLKAGAISHLEVHPKFPLVVHEQDCGAYIGDFAYLTADGSRVVEDVKSPRTAKLPVYRLKRRLIWALYGLTIQEVVM